MRDTKTSKVVASWTKIRGQDGGFDGNKRGGGGEGGAKGEKEHHDAGVDQ
jgi:hypothetical protein